ncbi:protein of unknown function [Agrobacterium pusense]|uniref:Uncharacterized protein n=1 Tax=Agrobacterium pusense TaxID=648995 RepID=U4PRF2_9HYPH|nr:protein of unknown function [Agrobacterium pusense]
MHSAKFYTTLVAPFAYAALYLLPGETLKGNTFSIVFGLIDQLYSTGRVKPSQSGGNTDVQASVRFERCRAQPLTGTWRSWLGRGADQAAERVL